LAHDGGERVKSWGGYYAATAGRPPRPTLLRALDAFAAEPDAGGRLALDLGCGIGRDTSELLRRGWRVIAIDAEPEAIEGLRAVLGPADATQVELRCERLEAARLPSCDLVNASFVLPFLDGAEFQPLWRRIAHALRPGGRFAGHLFGPRDSWVVSGRCIGHDRPALETLIRGFTLEHLVEEEEESTTPRGEPKRWHIWHLNLLREGSWAARAEADPALRPGDEPTDVAVVLEDDHQG
jgi:tellurite methyltransferase